MVRWTSLQVLGGLLVLWGAIAPIEAFAQEQIGRAALTRNEVSRVEPARLVQIGTGDDVFRDEVVRTGIASDAKLVFRDDTNLAIGPTSTVTLDRFVYAGDTSLRQAVVDLAKGAFRFTTGTSRKDAYEIRTPVATVGVRGTILDFLVETGRTTVVLQEGQARACARGGRCIELLAPGDSVVITAGGAVRVTRGGRPSWSFAARCASDAQLCGQTIYAALTPGEGAGNSIPSTPPVPAPGPGNGVPPPVFFGLAAGLFGGAILIDVENHHQVSH